MSRKDFVYECPEKVFEDRTISLHELRLYMIARSIMDVSGDVYASSCWFAERMDLSQLYIIECVRKLIRKGYVKMSLVNDRKGIKVINC
jgi:hypothetical protein